MRLRQNLTGVPDKVRSPTDAIKSPRRQRQNQMNLFKQQIAEVKISYSHKVKPSNQIKITSSDTAYKQVVTNWHDIDYRESFAVLLLSRNNKILGLSWISLGGTAGTVVDAKIIFQLALKTLAHGLILIHNHPSGNLLASDADLRITRKIKDGGKLLDIDVLDHLIITSEGYLSMADEGYM